MSREFSVIIERDAEGYYVGSVPALRGSHTQARSLDELMTRIRQSGPVVPGGARRGTGLMAKILRDCEMTREELTALL